VILAAILASGSGPGGAAGKAQSGSLPARSGILLGPAEGEALIGANGEVIIKVDAGSGSARLAMGTQQVLKGKGIAIHLHDHEDEILFVHRGSAIGIVGEKRRTLEAGSTVYIPPGVWHGVENPDGEVNLVWVMSPPGLESFFRDTRTPPGEPPKVLTPAQLEDIRRKHGIKQGAVSDEPPNKGMKQTTPGQLRSFAAYPRCYADPHAD